MIEFPVDIEMFKLYFLREAGLEYQAYPNWDFETTYAMDDKVVAIVNFKPGVYTSLKDDNDKAPSNEEYWELDIDETENLENVILDSDIERAMGEAIFKFNPKLFTEEKGKIIFLYLTMFFLVYDRQMAASGMNGNSAAGPVIHRTVGKMSVTYAESKLFKNYPSYEFLSTNDYGRKAFNLMMPYLRGGIVLLHGGATGE